MASAAVIGDGLRLGGFGLAGVPVHDAADPAAAAAAWEELPPDTALLVLDGQAASTLAGRLGERPALVWVVVPE